jgi:hypothetical protein
MIKEANNSLAQTWIMVDNFGYDHERKVYDVLSLLGDLGGIAGIVVSLVSSFILPVSSHSYTLKALKKLYKAGTKNPHIFLKERPKRERKLKKMDKISKTLEKKI